MYRSASGNNIKEGSVESETDSTVHDNDSKHTAESKLEEQDEQGILQELIRPPHSPELVWAYVKRQETVKRLNSTKISQGKVQSQQSI